MEKSTETTNYGTGIYADIQNLQDISREILIALIRRWPDNNVPAPTKLNLYVRADHADLWRVWATHTFSDIEVVVKGVQHYTLSATKNAADMAIAVDAISDFNHGRVTHVAVVSDDSDFISLYAKLAEEVNGFDSISPESSIPFLWVFTDRMGTRSALLQEFFPEKYVHIVDHRVAFQIQREEAEEVDRARREESRRARREASERARRERPRQEEAAPEPAQPVVSQVEESPAVEEAEQEPEPQPQPERKPEPPAEPVFKTEDPEEMSEVERIALQLIRDMPVGKFKSTDCQDIIRTNFPAHPLSAADGPRFGVMFRENVLGFMEKRGVKELGNQRPRQYEMTHEAKRSLIRS